LIEGVTNPKKDKYSSGLVVFGNMLQLGARTETNWTLKLWWWWWWWIEFSLVLVILNQEKEKYFCAEMAWTKWGMKVGNV